MPDPLQALPNELWSLCIEFAIAGGSAGPLDLIMVSRGWEVVLLSSPSLWTRIYIQNGEDEIARISTFLHLSKQCQLHVDVMTVLPTPDSLRLVAGHISRVRTISIRPGASENLTAFRAKQWRRAAAYALQNLSNSAQLSDLEPPACFGVTIWDDSRLHYHVILTQFTVAARASGVDEPSDEWGDRITNERIIPDPEDEDQEARAASISSIAALASQGEFHDAIRVAVPSLIKSLYVEESKVQLRTFDLMNKLANLNVMFRKAIASSIPLLVKRLDHKSGSIRSAVASLLERLAEHDEFHEAVRLTIPGLITLLEHDNLQVQSASVSLLGRLVKYGELREALKLAILPHTTLLGRGDSDAIMSTISLFRKLARHNKICKTMGIVIPPLIVLLEHKGLGIRSAAAFLLEELVEDGELWNELELTIPFIISLLGNLKQGIRSAAVFLLGELAKHNELVQGFRLAIPLFIKLLEDERWSVVLDAICALRQLIEHGEGKVHDALKLTILSLVKLLEHEDPDVRFAAATLLEKFAKYDELSAALWPAFPSLISLLEDWDPGTRSAATSLLERWLSVTSFRGNQA